MRVVEEMSHQIFTHRGHQVARPIDVVLHARLGGHVWNLSDVHIVVPVQLELVIKSIVTIRGLANTRLTCTNRIPITILNESSLLHLAFYPE